jgi:preprotein translocase subunit SecB
MQTSPLQLRALWIGKIVLESAVQPFTPVPETPVTVEANPVFRRNDVDHRNWIVELPVSFRSATDTPAAYQGSVTMTGAFVISGELPEEQQIKIVAVNAPSVLYSSIREVLAMLTAHGLYGKFLLPSVSFIDQKLSFPANHAEKAQIESK